MRDRVVFFILGALLATFAYFVGEMNLSAHNFEVGEHQVIPNLIVGKLLVNESIQVGGEDSNRIRMGFDDDLVRIDLLSANGKKHIALIVTKETGEDGAFIAIGDDTGIIRFMDTSSVNRFNKEYSKQE